MSIEKDEPQFELVEDYEEFDEDVDENVDEDADVERVEDDEQ